MKLICPAASSQLVRGKNPDRQCGEVRDEGVERVARRKRAWGSAIHSRCPGGDGCTRGTVLADRVEPLLNAAVDIWTKNPSGMFRKCIS